MITHQLQVALAKDVHPDQDLELECIAKFEAYDFFKDERECWRAVHTVGLDGDSKPIMFDLALTVRRGDRALSATNQPQRFCDSSGDAA